MTASSTCSICIIDACNARLKLLEGRSELSCHAGSEVLGLKQGQKLSKVRFQGLDFDTGLLLKH